MRTLGWIILATFTALYEVEAAAPDKPGSATAVSGQARVPSESAKRRDDRILVRFKDNPRSLGNRQLVSSIHGARVRKEFRRVRNLTVIEVPRGQVDAALARFRASPRVKYAEPDAIVEAILTPNDPMFHDQWALQNSGQVVDGYPGTAGSDIRATDAWDFWTGTDATIAVIDTGVDYTHPDLAANMWRNPGETGLDNQVPPQDKATNGYDDDGNGYVDDVYGYDFYNGDADPFDDHYHGTHVAGIIGAVGNNNVGVAGVNWNCKIAALKFLGAHGGGPISAAIEAIEYATDKNIRISNNSWGCFGEPHGSTNEDHCYSQALYDAIEESQSVGHVFVAAAGNWLIGFDMDIYVPSYPAYYSLPNIISVGATDSNDSRAWFSLFGQISVDLFAPGENILSTLPGGYGYLSGTSMAAPHVAGVLGLVLSRQPTLTWSQAKDRIILTTRHVESLEGHCVTAGVVNAEAAVADCDGNGVLDETDIAGAGDDCNLNTVLDSCEPDCNNNDVSDLCDVTGTSDDCDGNSIPDECQPDCNANLIADLCDITSGAPDCNENGIPDGCEPNWAADCDNNGTRDMCDLYLGMGEDCNTNYVLDSCDISTQTSQDCTANGMPDECENDCNANDVADSCDILGGALDTNNDGVPDSCDLGFTFKAITASGSHTIAGNTIYLDDPGQRVEFEVHLNGWDPDRDGYPLVRIFQILIDPGQISSDGCGAVSFASPLTCEDHSDCMGDSLCDGEQCDIYGSVNINESHPDYLFFGLDQLTYAYGFAQGPGRGAAAVLWDGGQVDTGESEYLATVLLDVSSDATGTFEIGLDTGNSFLTDPFVFEIPSPGFHSGRIVIVPDEDCDANGVEDFCDLANDGDCNVNGVYDGCEYGGLVDCNGNDTPDLCDLYAGTSGDCDDNGIPDECEDDCNDNGIRDRCEILSGAVQDCNGDDIPDGCAGQTHPFAQSITAVGSRYLAITPSFGSATPVAIRVQGDGIHEEVGCLDQYVQADGTLGKTAVFQTPQEWCRVYVRGLEIIPQASYTVDMYNGSNWTAPVTVATYRWGDADQNGLINAIDIGKTVDASHGLLAPSIMRQCDFLTTWEPLDCMTNALVNDSDVDAAVDAVINGPTSPYPCGPADCNENGQGDLCETENSPTQDCNGNDVPDICELATGALQDCNGDDIPDICSGQPHPFAQSIVAQGSRYITVTPSFANSTPVAVRVRGDGSEQVVGCMELYVQANGTLASTPLYQTPQEWCRVHVHGLEIRPETTYRVDLHNGTSWTQAVSVTTWKWGDVNNNGVANVIDYSLVTDAMNGLMPLSTIRRYDLLAGYPSPLECIPDGQVTAADQAAVFDVVIGYPSYPCPPPASFCSDGIACTTDSCQNSVCVHTPVHSACGDGLFCNGSETCSVTFGCQAGTSPCADSVACTVDSCNESNDTCSHVPNNGLCNDGLFCNGAETCNASTGCVAGSNPCPPMRPVCNESTDSCSRGIEE